MQPSALHGLGLSWIASHSLKEGRERLVRFQKILATELELKLNETPAGYCIEDKVGQKRDPFRFPDATYDAQIASIFKVCQIMMGPDVCPTRVSFEHPEPPCSEKFEQFFGLPAIFNAEKTAIEFDRATSELSALSPSPELTRINDQIVIDYLYQFEQEDIVTQTKKFPAKTVPGRCELSRPVEPGAQ